MAPVPFDTVPIDAGTVPPRAASPRPLTIQRPGKPCTRGGARQGAR